MQPQDYSRPKRAGWQGFFAPLQAPPVVAFDPEPHSPIRDDSQLGPTEDLERQPDGVPHVVVAQTAAFSVMFAVLVLSIFFLSSVVAKVGAVLLIVLAVPVLVRKLSRKSERERDHRHPSR
ncbi:hypothetical protein BH11MYX1_BH11MYX1_11510 [soil metagenome]